jgi:hypothetical protein
MEDTTKENDEIELSFAPQDADCRIEFFRDGRRYLRASRHPDEQGIDVSFTTNEGIGYLPFATVTAKAMSADMGAVVLAIADGDGVKGSVFSSGKWTLMFDGVIDRTAVRVDNEAPSFISIMQVRSAFAERCGRPISWHQTSTSWRKTLAAIAKECGFSDLVCSPKSDRILDNQIDISGQCDTSFGALKLLGFMLDLSVAPGRDGDVELLPVGAVGIGKDPVIVKLSEVKSYTRSVI